MDHYSNARVTPATPKAVAAIAMLTAVLLSFLVALPSQAYAADSDYETVTLEGVQYYQTEARTMLDMINDFRTGGDAWYYTAKDDGTKKYAEGLSEVEYDYTLEKIAMQRAAECAIFFEHTRPNGKTATSQVLPKEYGYSQTRATGEALEGGSTTASHAFRNLQESYAESFSGQGHRRQLLSKNLTRIGIGCAYYNGHYKWALVTASDIDDHGDVYTEAFDGTKDVDVVVAPNCQYVKSKSISLSESDMALGVNSTANLPSATGNLTYKDDTGQNGRCESTVTVHPTWTSSDESVATVDAEAGTVTATGYGTATLTATSLGATADVTVSVTKEIADAYIEDIEDQTFDGTEHKPALSITYDGETLAEGTDYTATYANNRAAGTATVTVTGIGTYSGSTTREFTINKAQGSCTITDQVKDYDGTAYTLEPTTKPGGVNCTFEYFEDEACTNAISEAGAAQPGIHYVRATSAEHRNYTSAVSNVAKLTIKGPASITMADDLWDYDGTAKTYNGDVTIEGGTEVSYEYFADEACTQPISAPVNAGTYYVKGTLTGDELHTDATATAKLTIDPIDLEDITVSKIEPQTYTGSAVTPFVSVTMDGRLLSTDDYYLTYENNVNVGNAMLIVHGKRNYTAGTVAIMFTIERATSTVSIEDLSKAYDGKAYTSTVKADPAGTAYALKYFSDAACTNAITESEAAQVGTCYVKAVIAETANYTGAESNVAKLTINKAKSSVSAAAQSATYNGHAVDYTGKVTKSGSNESISITYYADAACTKQIATPVNAGTYYVKAELAGNSNYEPACAVAKLTINKASNTAKVSAAKKTVKYSKVKKKAQTVKPIKVSKAQGKVTYKKSSGSSKIKVAKNGKVTVKKGTKKGTYKVKVKVTAAGNGNYKAYTKTITVTVKVK